MRPPTRDFCRGGVYHPHSRASRSSLHARPRRGRAMSLRLWTGGGADDAMVCSLTGRIGGSHSCCFVGFPRRRRLLAVAKLMLLEMTVALFKIWALSKDVPYTMTEKATPFLPKRGAGHHAKMNQSVYKDHTPDVTGAEVCSGQSYDLWF